MATLLGNASQPSYGQQWFGSGNGNQTMMALYLPAGGPWQVTQVGGWFAGQSSSPQAWMCCWAGSGVLIGYSSMFTLSSRPFGMGQSDNYLLAMAAVPILAGGSPVYVGIERASGGAHQYPIRNGGSAHVRYTNTGGSPANVGGGGTVDSNELGVYLYYESSNAAPNPPDQHTPLSGLITGTDLTPALSFRYTDPNSNNMSAYQIQIDAGLPHDFAAPAWDSGKVALVQAHGSTVIASPPSSLTRGILYGWRARVWDSFDAVSAWGYG